MNYTSVILGLGLLLFAVGCSASRQPAENEAAISSATSNVGNASNANSDTDAPPMRAPITWNEVAASYEQIRDYTSLYLKEERAISNGELQTIRLAFRKPLDVRLEWLNEKGKVDQTAVYRQGFNDNKVLARQSSLLGALAGTMKLKPDDQLALEDSRHPITEAGLGGLIEHFKDDAANVQVSNRVVGEDIANGRRAWKFLFTAKGCALGGLKGACRSIVWIDQELKLPVQAELYDQADGLLERHRFRDLKLNVGLTDQNFKL